MKRKYIIKKLSQLLMLKICERSQNYFIAKSFEKEIKFKAITICKFNAPSNFLKNSLHFLLTISLIKSSKSLQNYFHREVSNKHNYLYKEQNISTLNNMYPLLIKNNNLFFSKLKVYKSFFYFFAILKLLLKLNVNLFLLANIKQKYLI